MSASRNIVPSRRTCILCNRKRPREELIRIASRVTDDVGMDDLGRAQGRGAYLCSHKDSICDINRLKRQRVESALKFKIRAANWDKFIKDLSYRYEPAE